MKSSEFITEVKDYQHESISIEKAVALLNEHCRESLATIHAPLWRGMRDHFGEVVTIDPTTGLRKSANTSNYYTLLIDNSPYFEGWPKRSKSLICSTWHRYASDYGRLYAIFPFDGVKIAVCHSKDIWETQVNIPELGIHTSGPDSMRRFNQYLYRIGFPQSWHGIVKAAKSEATQKSLRLNVLIALQDRIPSPDNVLPTLLAGMAPELTKFKLMSIAEFAAEPPQNKECWVGGPVVAIRKDIYEKFLDAVQQGAV